MEGKRYEQIFSKFAKLFSTMHHSESEAVKHFYDEKLVNPLIDEQLEVDDYFKSSQKKSSKNAEFQVDSDEEFKAELEMAVKQYRKNIKKNEPIGIKLNLHDEKGNCENQNLKSQNLNRVDDVNDFKEKNREKINCEVNSRGNASNDIQDLLNYFFLGKKEKDEIIKCKSYIDYEKQGAIPKNRVVRGKSRELNRNKFETKNAQVGDLKLIKNKSERNQDKVLEAILDQNWPGIKESLEEYTFMRNSDTDHFIIKIKEESCSRPFFYIVPENPSPNFFLSRGSYYVIPKTPSAASESRIFFHPESKTEWDVGASSFDLKILDNENNDVVQDSRIVTNNLGKEVFQKLDSHLNIGPMDVKHSDSENNLETNCNSNKIFNKTLLTFNSPNASSGSEEETGTEFSPKNTELRELNSEKAVEENEVNSELLLKIGGQNVNSDEKLMSEAETFRLRQLDKVLQILLLEFPDLESDFAKIIADKYLLDENGLRNYITTIRDKRKMEHQSERMILALPEDNFEELRDKSNEFRGVEGLVRNYTEEAKKANKIRQQVLDLRFILPDANPDFLREEIEKLSGAAGDNNKEDLELVLKFLQSKYPSKARDFLIQAFESNNRNITKTCDPLNDQQLIRLSESSFRYEEVTEAFLEELCHIDHKKEVDQYLTKTKERKEIEKEDARINQSFLTCPLCADDELIASEALCCAENHIFCKDCIKRYISVKMGEGMFKFTCPSENCDAFLSFKTLQEILSENILSDINIKQQAEKIIKAKALCPNCTFPYIYYPEDKIFKCQNPTCLKEMCR